jgi:PAS domain S-box-containing protein
MENTGKTKQELIEELQACILQFNSLKESFENDISARKLTEEKLLSRSELLSAFNRYSIELSEQDNDNIQQFIVNSFKSLFRVRAVWISIYYEKNSELVLENSTVTEEEKSLLIKKLGQAFKNFKTLVDDERLRMIIESGTRIYTSLHDISFGQIPVVASRAIEKLFGVEWFQGVGLIDKEKLLGTLVIAGYKGQEPLPEDIVKVFADITSSTLRRKEAENKLHASETLFRKAFTTSPDSININRVSDGTYISVNHGFSKITGYSYEEVVGKTSFELNIWADSKARERLVKGLQEKGEVENLETKFRMKNGTFKDGIMSATIIELDGVKHILSITRDITDRKTAEDKVHKSEEKYRLLAENISDVIWILDAETMYFTYISPSVERLRGYTPEEIISRPMTEALSPEAAAYISQSTRERAAAILAGKENPGGIDVTEVEQPRKDGTSVWTEVVTTFYVNKNTGKVEVLGVTRDISERKKAADALKQSEIYFADIFENANIGLAYTTLDGKILAMNKALEEIVETPKEKIIGKNLIQIARHFLKGKNLETAMSSINDLLAKKTVKPFQIEVGNKILEVTANSNKNSDRLTGIVHDITEKKQAEEEIHKIGQHYRALIEKAPDGIILLDSGGSMKFASSSARKMFGYGIDDEMPADPSLFTHPDDLQRVLSELTLIFQNPSYTPTLVYRFADKNGNWLWIESTFSNLLEEPSVQSIVINFRNISDRKQAEDEIHRLNAGLEERVNERTAQLEAVNSELQAFAYSVSHDLRAPLRAIDGFSKFVLEDYGSKLDSEGQRLLGLIRSNTQKMDKLITDILSLSRVARTEHKKSDIDMTKMAFSMYNEVVLPELQGKINLIIDPLPEAFADSTFIKQVWINLISNAVKFTSLRSNPEIRIGAYKEDKSNVYFIKDNGVGFNPDYSHKLFGVFQRLHKANEFEGTGVGLAIVQRIINRHGGRVWAEGREGYGATFYFSLPS